LPQLLPQLPPSHCQTTTHKNAPLSPSRVACTKPPPNVQLPPSYRPAPPAAPSDSQLFPSSLAATASSRRRQPAATEFVASCLSRPLPASSHLLPPSCPSAARQFAPSCLKVPSVTHNTAQSLPSFRPATTQVPPSYRPATDQLPPSYRPVPGRTPSNSISDSPASISLFPDSDGFRPAASRYHAATRRQTPKLPPTASQLLRLPPSFRPATAQFTPCQRPVYGRWTAIGRPRPMAAVSNSNRCRLQRAWRERFATCRVCQLLSSCSLASSQLHPVHLSYRPVAAPNDSSAGPSQRNVNRFKHARTLETLAWASPPGVPQLRPSGAPAAPSSSQAAATPSPRYTQLPPSYCQAKRICIQIPRRCRAPNPGQPLDRLLPAERSAGLKHPRLQTPAAVQALASCPPGARGYRPAAAQPFPYASRCRPSIPPPDRHQMAPHCRQLPPWYRSVPAQLPPAAALLAQQLPNERPRRLDSSDRMEPGVIAERIPRSYRPATAQLPSSYRPATAKIPPKYRPAAPNRAADF